MRCPCVQSLNWVYGTASSVANNVVNLSDGYSERVCYLAAHTAVIYDKRTQRQQFMQVRSSAACSRRVLACMQGTCHAKEATGRRRPP